jgi:D-allulose-6-phosphate 3-epimerase
MGALKISPSLICMNLLQVERQIMTMNKLANCYHFDLIDNHFAPSFGLPIDFLLQIKGISSIPIDVHLMVEDVETTTETVLRAGADVVTLPIEGIVNNAFRVISRVKQAGVRVGIALNPITPVESLKYVLPLADKITVLMFDPGFAGQKLVNITLDKVSAFAKEREVNGHRYDIEVDGSCNKENYKDMLSAGANQFVVGRSGLFQLDENIETAWQKMKEYMNG